MLWGEEYSLCCDVKSIVCVVRWRNAPRARRHLSMASWILSVKVWMVVPGHFIFLILLCASDKILRLCTKHFNLSCIKFFSILKNPIKWILFNFGHPVCPLFKKRSYVCNFHHVWENTRIKRSIEVHLYIYIYIYIYICKHTMLI